MKIQVRLEGEDYAIIQTPSGYGYELLLYTDKGKGLPKRVSPLFYPDLESVALKLGRYGLHREDSLPLQELIYTQDESLEGTLACGCGITRCECE